MLFNSYSFWAFFALVIVLYHALAHRGQNRMLLAASYVFYGSWDWRFLALIWISTLVDYHAALGLARPGATAGRRRALLGLSVGVNLGLLGTFKYCNFFVGEMVELLRWAGLDASPPVLQIILPVGISFYTFQTMSYTIDVYRGRAQPIDQLPDFALFVCFFPQLVAGPIERSSHLLPQITAPRPRSPRHFSEGLYLVLSGLVKKVVVADNMKPISDVLFARDPATLSATEAAVALWAFSIQLYCDFSGYSSIAQGLARWLGIELIDNFRMPYFATSPADLWRRWHVSLSSWFRDYVYISLGGNRRGRARTYLNLFLTMLLSGFWHGAAWTMITWGGYHGVLLAIHRGLRTVFPGGEALSPALAVVRRLAAAFLMFQLYALGLAFFRSTSMSQAWTILGRLFDSWQWNDFALGSLGLILFYATPLFAYEAWVEKQGNLLALTRKGPLVQAVAYTVALLVLIFLPAPNAREFIYFQF